jgi:polar amino acid transport system substrate-binding protein
MTTATRRLRRFPLITAIIFSLCLALSGCTSSNALGYRTIKTKESAELCFSFRDGDPTGALFNAVCAELCAQGKIAELSAKWLGGAETGFKPDSAAVAGAMSQLQISEIAARDFILGIDEFAVPFSFQDGGVFTGFDVDLASAVCERLGWTLKLQAASSFDIKLELIGGNIDCAGGSLGLTVSGGGVSVSAPYLTESYVILVRADSGIRRVAGLSGNKLYMRDDIETINIYQYGEQFKDLDITKKYLPTLNDCVDSLKQGECDAVLLGAVEAAYLTR